MWLAGDIISPLYRLYDMRGSEKDSLPMTIPISFLSQYYGHRGCAMFVSVLDHAMLFTRSNVKSSNGGFRSPLVAIINNTNVQGVLFYGSFRAPDTS